MTLDEAMQAMAASLAPACARQATASDALRGLLPSELDWATHEERAEFERLRRFAVNLGSTRAEAQRRVAAKRAARIAAFENALTTPQPRAW